MFDSSQKNVFSVVSVCVWDNSQTHGGVRNGSETHETVLLDCTTSVEFGLDLEMPMYVRLISKEGVLSCRCVCVWESSQNARGCAKWQWNARDCVTGLHDRRSRECNPVTSVECVLLSFRTPPCVLAFITYLLWTDGIAMALVYWICHNKVAYFFKFAICSIALLNLGETCHLMGRGMVTVWCTVLLLCCCDCESTQQYYDITLLDYILWRHTMHEWVMNIHYQNIIRTPSKQWGMCDKERKSVRV